MDLQNIFVDDTEEVKSKKINDNFFQIILEQGSIEQICKAIRERRATEARYDKGVKR